MVCPQGKVLKRAAYDRRKGLLKKSGPVNAEEKWVFNVVESREVLFTNGKIMQKLRPSGRLSSHDFRRQPLGWAFQWAL